MRRLYAAGLATIFASVVVAGISAGAQLQLLPVFQAPQKPAAAMQPALATPAPAEQQNPSVIVIEMADGTCVDPEYRRTWTISEGETAGDIALATLNGVEDWLDKAYKILILNEAEAEEYALPVGQSLLIGNDWQKPMMRLPEKPIVLETGQQIILKPGRQGLLCGSSHITLETSAFQRYFDAQTNTFRWTPRLYDTGIHKVVFRAGDEDITTYGAGSHRALDKSPSVLRVEGTVELRVKVKPQEFVTDNNPPVRYRLVSVNDGFTPALTIDGKVAYLLDMGRTVNYMDVVSAQKLAANPEVAFAILHQRLNGYTISSGSDLEKAADYLRRWIETDGRPEQMEHFSFGIALLQYRFPVVTGEVQLSQTPQITATGK